MTRQLFAFLALLSGLGAISTPAQASLVDAMACDASIAACAQDDAGAEQPQALDYAKPAKSDGAIVQAEYAAARLTKLRLPVLMGIERAYE